MQWSKQVTVGAIQEQQGAQTNMTPYDPVAVTDGVTTSQVLGKPVSVFALDASAFDPSTGINSDPALDYLTKSARFGNYNMPRPFFTSGSNASWSNGQLSALHDGEVPVVSQKIGAGANYSALLSFFNAMPAHLPQMWWCYHHEPRNTGDVTPQQYRAAWVVAWNARAASVNAARIGLVKILMSYQMRFNGQVWSDYFIHPAGEGPPDLYCCDVAGVDAYNESWTPEAKANGGYEPPIRSCLAAKTISDATGLPFALTEFGAMRYTDDSAGIAAQLAWDQGAYEWCIDNGGLWAGLWCDNDPSWKWPQRDPGTDPVSTWVAARLLASKGTVIPIPTR